VTRRPPIKRLARSAGLLLALYPAPAPNSEEAFDHAELIENFEYPICQSCMGTGWVRDENGIHRSHATTARERAGCPPRSRS
jgi:hypothetical protein